MYLLLIYFLILVVPIAVMPGYIRTGKMSPYRTVMQATLIVTVMIVIVFMVASMTGKGVFAQLQELIDDMSKELANNPMVEDSLNLASVSKADRIEFISGLYKSAFAVMPATIMAMSAVVSYIEYIIISKIMSRRVATVRRMPKFREFTWPGSALMGIMGMYLLSWLLTKTGVFADSMVYMNIDFLFNFMFSLQGVSVVFMFCHMKRIPKVIGVIAAVILWMTYFGRMALLLIGMIDLVFGIKKRIQGRSS